MITEIKIENFQSHKNTTISFTKGLNVVAGSSDSGKSSIVRALLWVLTNRPTGDAIRNWNTDKDDVVSVSVSLDDGKKVVKERQNGKSRYLIGKKKFEAIKQDVPSEVDDIFNISSCNIQTQHDPYFLINDSPGEVARKLNEIVGLDIIDTIYKNIEKRSKTSATAIKIANGTIEKLEEDLEQLVDAEDFLADVKALRKKNSEWEELQRSVKQLSNLLADYSEIKLKSLAFKEKSEAEEDVRLLLEKANYYVKDMEQTAKLNKNASLLLSFQAQIDTEISWLECESKCEVLLDKIKVFRDYENDLVFLRRQFQELKTTTKNIRESLDDVTALAEDYKLLLKKENMCPMCHTKLTSDMIKNIVGEL